MQEWEHVFASGVYLTPCVTEMNMFQVHVWFFIPLNSCANWKVSAVISLLHAVLPVTINMGEAEQRIYFPSNFINVFLQTSR